MTICAALLVALFLFDYRPPNISIYLRNEIDYKQLIIKDEMRVLMIMIFKVFMYYYQSLGHVLSSQNITNSLLPLISFFSLSLDYSSSSNSNSGICIIPFISSPLLKILTSPIFVGLLVFNICWMGILSNLYYKKKTNLNMNEIELEMLQLEEKIKKQQQSETQQSSTMKPIEPMEPMSRKPVIVIVILKIFIMTAGMLLGMGLKLLSCITMPATQHIVHFYDAGIVCVFYFNCNFSYFL